MLFRSHRCLQAGHSLSRVDFRRRCVRQSVTSGAVVRSPHLLQQTVVRYSCRGMSMTGLCCVPPDPRSTPQHRALWSFVVAACFVTPLVLGDFVAAPTPIPRGVFAGCPCKGCIVVESVWLLTLTDLRGLLPHI